MYYIYNIYSITKVGMYVISNMLTVHVYTFPNSLITHMISMMMMMKQQSDASGDVVSEKGLRST